MDSLRVQSLTQHPEVRPVARTEVKTEERRTLPY
jgi:DNA-directed RNA polymerase I, II, and III subunit RPABC2